MARQRVIGLLGGSFNPAHEGHVHLSLEALRHLQLDAVWWLVSPHNPLKQKSSLADYALRLHYAQQLAAPYPHIQVSDYEHRHQLFYSVDSIRHLNHSHPQHRFIWLMGADNLACFDRWRQWTAMFATLPIAVFDRAPFSHAALRSKAALRFRHFRIAACNAPLLAHLPLPAWSYIHMPRHPASATELRKTLGNKSFLLHTEGDGNA